mgnify:CR=1 FL=1
MGLDICVDLYNTEAMLRAVRLGVEVVIIGLLQEIYLFQTVHERYQNNNNLSSRNLEQVDGRNTYYYNFFEQIVKIVEDAEASRQTEMCIIYNEAWGNAKRGIPLAGEEAVNVENAQNSFDAKA